MTSTVYNYADLQAANRLALVLGRHFDALVSGHISVDGYLSSASLALVDEGAIALLDPRPWPAHLGQEDRIRLVGLARELLVAMVGMARRPSDETTEGFIEARIDLIEAVAEVVRVEGPAALSDRDDRPA